MIVKWQLSIGFQGATKKGTLHIDDEDLEGMNDEQRDEFISDLVWENATQNHVETWWDVVEDD